jgi:hypothetical protein
MKAPRELAFLHVFEIVGVYHKVIDTAIKHGSRRVYLVGFRSRSRRWLWWRVVKIRCENRSAAVLVESNSHCLGSALYALSTLSVQTKVAGLPMSCYVLPGKKAVP